MVVNDMIYELCIFAFAFAFLKINTRERDRESLLYVG